MLIREAKSEDGKDLVRLLDQLGYPEMGPLLGNKLRALAGQPHSGVLVAEVDGGIKGFLAYQFFVQLGTAGDFCRISYFCVDDTVHGRGIGAALEQEVAERAAGRGCDRIEVHCSAARLGAHAFYGKRGYVESPKYFMKSLKDA